MARWSLLLIAIPIIVGIYFQLGGNKNTVPWNKIVNNDNVIDVDVDANGKSFIVATPEGKTREVFVSQDSKVSTDDLNSLLLSYGVDPDGLLPVNDKDIKIPLLLRVSSRDFWRRNYFLHPRRARVSNWLDDHKSFLGEVEALKLYNDKDDLKKKFSTIYSKLDGIAIDFEDKQMFKFFKENIKNNDEFLKIIDELEYDHVSIEKQAKKIQKDWASLSFDEIQSQISDMEKDIVAHFTKEEQNIPTVFLNIDSELYKKYRSDYAVINYFDYIMEQFFFF